jgi:hypothetical protein
VLKENLKSLPAFFTVRLSVSILKLPEIYWHALGRVCLASLLVLHTG